MSDKTLRILILEDLPSDANLNEREARKVFPDCQFLRVETRGEFLKALESFRPDIILSDYKLPEFDGLGALKLALEHAPQTPFIIITGSMNEDTAVECMKAGAWDYVIKEHIKRLGPAAINAMEQKRLRIERKVEESARRDAETRFRLLFEHSPDGILIIDPETARILEFNETAHRQLDYSREEFSRLNISDIDAVETYEETRSRIARVMNEGRIDFETRHRTRNGEIRDVQVTELFTYIQGSRIYHCVCRDITERRQMEDALKEKINALQRFHNLTVGRELAMIALKKEVNELLKKTGQEEKYRIVD